MGKILVNKTNLEKRNVLKELQTIPSVGKAVAADLWNIGIRSVSDLTGQSPNLLYEELNKFSNAKNDICVLYTFRCAVYFATETRHQKEKLKWWYWKDKVYID